MDFESFRGGTKALKGKRAELKLGKDTFTVLFTNAAIIYLHGSKHHVRLDALLPTAYATHL